MPHLRIEIVAPDRRVFKGEARGVQAPGTLGSFEVLCGHAPMVSAIDIGAVRVTTSGGDRVFFATSGGFLEIVNDGVTVLVTSAEPASEIDLERARAAEARALERLRKAEPDLDRGRAEAALERARNRVRVAMGRVGARG